MLLFCVEGLKSACFIVIIWTSQDRDYK